MTRLCAAALSSALLLTLPACTPSGQPAGSSAPAEPEHLAFYDSFETWNQEVPSNSVQVEEVERDGLLQYRFWNEASGLELFVLPGWRDEAGQPHDPTAEAAPDSSTFRPGSLTWPPWRSGPSSGTPAPRLSGCPV